MRIYSVTLQWPLILQYAICRPTWRLVLSPVRRAVLLSYFIWNILLLHVVVFQVRSGESTWRPVFSPFRRLVLRSYFIRDVLAGWGSVLDRLHGGPGPATAAGGSGKRQPAALPAQVPAGDLRHSHDHLLASGHARQANFYAALCRYCRAWSYVKHR